MKREYKMGKKCVRGGANLLRYFTISESLGWHHFDAGVCSCLATFKEDTL